MINKDKAINFGTWGLGLWTFHPTYPLSDFYRSRLFSSPIKIGISLCSTFFLFSSFLPTLAQENSFQYEIEGVRPLDVNPALFGKNKKSPPFYLKNSNNWVYNIDTLDLPFVDDFSVDRVKNFSVDTGDPNVNTIIKNRFEVNGNFQDSVELMNDTTWFYQFDTLAQQYDSFPNNPDLFITFFENNNPDSLSELTLPTDTDTVWSNITYRYNLSDTDTIILSRDTILFNSRDTFFIVQDDDFYLWLDNTAFINTGFEVNPPTIGVATFDGLDENGIAYDFSNSSSYGPADFLTSKPIDLGNLTSDSSVILSFYYQPQGVGDFPDLEDSLSLEFYSPSDSLWHWAWSTPGITLTQSYQQPVFQPVMIAISDSIFLKKGFQFRFRNYATLSGMLDIWNVDYVYLDKNRNINDNSVNDLAFVSIGNSFINDYTSMPMDAFKENAAQFMVQNFQVKLANLGNSTVINDSNRYFIYDEYETFEYKESVNIQQTFAPLSQEVINHSVISSPNNFLFTPVDSDRVVFKIKFISEQQGPDLNKYNDTAVHRQVFDSYYSYDDGSAEGAYFLNSVGAKVAYKFANVFADSLRGIYLFFPYLWNDISQFTFKIFVWGDNNGVPGGIIYQGPDLVNPYYSQSNNEFVRYKIDPPIALSGTFYIGWEQTTADKIYLGFDKNINNQSKIFYNLTGNWTNTSKAGSLMMRPDFGFPEPNVQVVYMNKKETSFSIYPNPAKDIIYIDNLNKDAETEKTILRIYNALGEEIFNRTIFNLNSLSPINISSVPNGIYFLRIENENSKSSATKKLIVAR